VGCQRRLTLQVERDAAKGSGTECVTNIETCLPLHVLYLVVWYQKTPTRGERDGEAGGRAGDESVDSDAVELEVAI